MDEDPGRRPYLEGPIDFSQTHIFIEWARYLGTTFGASGALCALRYYERLDWISPAVREHLEHHLQGLSLAEVHSKKYDSPIRLEGPLATLSGTSFAAHARSLEFIAQLARDNLQGHAHRVQHAKHRVDADLSFPDHSTDHDTQSPSLE